MLKQPVKAIFVSIGALLILLALLVPLFMQPKWYESHDLTLLVGQTYDEEKLSYDRTVGYLRMIVLSAGVALLASAFLWDGFCRRKGVFLSLLSLSAFGGMGLGLAVCVIVTHFAGHGWFAEGSKAAVLCGLACLAAFLLSAYTFYRWKQPLPSRKTLFRNGILAILYGLPAYYLSGILFSHLCHVVRIQLW